MIIKNREHALLKIMRLVKQLLEYFSIRSHFLILRFRLSCRLRSHLTTLDAKSLTSLNFYIWNLHRSNLILIVLVTLNIVHSQFILSMRLTLCSARCFASTFVSTVIEFGIWGLYSSFCNSCATFRPGLWSISGFIVASPSIIRMWSHVELGWLMASSFTSWPASGGLALSRHGHDVIIHSGTTVLNCLRLLRHFHIWNGFKWIWVSLLGMWVWNASWRLLRHCVTVFPKRIISSALRRLGLLGKLWNLISIDIGCSIHAFSQVLHVHIYLRN